MQFRSDPFLAPRRIRRSHGDNQLLKIRGVMVGRAPSTSIAKEAESFAMPSDQHRWVHDRQHGSPVDQPGERDQLALYRERQVKPRRADDATRDYPECGRNVRQEVGRSGTRCTIRPP